MHAHPVGLRLPDARSGSRIAIVHNHGGAFLDGVAEYERIGLIRTRELGDALAQLARHARRRDDARSRHHDRGRRTCAARRSPRCTSRRALALQLAMLAAAGGDAAVIRAYDRDEAERVSDQLEGPMLERAWEYFAAKVASEPAP